MQLKAEDDVRYISYQDAIDFYKELQLFFKDVDILYLQNEHQIDILNMSLQSPQNIFYKTSLYPSIEEKASRLLYSVIRNKPFPKGNKRMACILYLEFLYRNISKMNYELSIEEMDNLYNLVIATEKDDRLWLICKEDIIKFTSKFIHDKDRMKEWIL